MVLVQLDETTIGERLYRARRLLERPKRRERAGVAFLAAVFFAASAIGLAAAVVTGPQLGFTPVAPARAG